jgi:hypothetical protein
MMVLSFVSASLLADEPSMRGEGSAAYEVW